MRIVAQRITCWPGVIGRAFMCSARETAACELRAKALVATRDGIALVPLDLEGLQHHPSQRCSDRGQQTGRDGLPCKAGETEPPQQAALAFGAISQHPLIPARVEGIPALARAAGEAAEPSVFMR